MKRSVILVLLLWITSGFCLAQRQGYVKETFNSEAFPEVSFIWHDYSLDPLTQNDFRYVKESGVRVPYKMELVENASLDQPKSVIILWEDMNEVAGGRDVRVGQYKFTKSVLSEFFSNRDIRKEDGFNVMAFNRRKNNPTVLIPITVGFSNDGIAIGSQVASYAHSTETYREFPNRSDMFSAIRESLDTLKAIADEQVVKSVVVITAGYAMTNSGNDSESQVLEYAQRLHIPIYILEYFPRSGYATRPENFAKSTNGSFSAFDQNQVTDAVNELERINEVVAKSYLGKDYQVTFTSNMRRGADPVAIAFDVNGVEYQEQFLPPPFSLKIWMQEHRLLVLLLVLLLIALITLAIIFSVRAHRQKQIQLEKLEEKQRQSEQQAQVAVAQTYASLDQLRKGQEQHQSEDNTRKMTDLMRAKNYYPRLHCEAGENRFVYYVKTPVVTLGRAADNNLVLNNRTVSSHHAQMIYTGDGFKLIDLNSSNHVIVNGLVIKEHDLKNGDLIVMGEVRISYYV